MKLAMKNAAWLIAAAGCLGVTPASANLLADPGFELPEVGAAPATVPISPPADPSLSPWTAFNTAGVTNRQARPGSPGDQSLRLAPNAPTGTGTGIARQEFDASANDVFTFGAWVFHEASNPVTGPREGQLRIQWLNANSTLINQVVLDVVDETTPTNQWVFVELENYQLPDNANITTVRPSLFVTNNGGVGGGAVFFDDVSFVLETLGGLVGDFNSDGFVSQGDLDLVLLNWGANVAPVGFNEDNLDGGGPFDGLMSQNELDGVLLNWGNGTSPGLTAVPEPAGLVLLGLGTLALAGRGRSSD